MRNTVKSYPVMLEIDGAQKSGSGTIVRDVVSLASLTGQEVHIRNIRARRRKPGLRPQHVTAVNAVAEICNGTIQGAEVGSGALTYSPGDIFRGGEFAWDIGTAGSTTMLAFTVLPTALFAAAPSEYTITGGLFQDFAPTAFHLKYVFLPILRAMGVEVTLQILQPGYVPRGGGRILLQVTNVEGCLRPLNLQQQGEGTQVRGIALSSRLKDRKVSERMAGECRTVLERAGYSANIEIKYDTAEAPTYQSVAHQPGAALAIWAETSTGCLIGSDRAGARGRSSESIGKYTANALLEDLGSRAAVDRYLADQIIPYAALAEGTTRIAIPRMTDHVETRLWLAEEMLGAAIEEKTNQLIIKGIGFRVNR